MWRALWVIRTIRILGLRIVVTISPMPMIFVICIGPASRHPVDHTIHIIVNIFNIFIFVLVGIPIWGSIGERISSLPLPLMTRRWPRTLFSTHIGSSRIVSAGVISWRESSRGVPVGISRSVSCVMSCGRSWSRIVSMGSRWWCSWWRSCAESVVCSRVAGWRVRCVVCVHDILLLRCPKGTLKMKRKRVEGALSRGTEECDKPVTLVFGLYRRKERKPVSLIRTCQEPASIEILRTRISWCRSRYRSLRECSWMSWTIDPARQCICKRCDIAFGVVGGLVVEKTGKGRWLGAKRSIWTSGISLASRFVCCLGQGLSVSHRVDLK